MTANSEITLEVCYNNEAIREWCGFDLSGIEESLQHEAADELRSELDRRLNDAGYATEWAKGNRVLCHGWHGANTFTHKLGAVGTFDDLTEAQRDDIFEIQAAAEKAIVERFSE